MSDSLIAFLHARLDEDEAAALAWPETQRRWEERGKRQVTYDNGVSEQMTAVSVGGDGPLGWERIHIKRDAAGDLGAHLAAHDPARVLREAAIKRGLLDEFETEARFIERGHSSPQGGQEAREAILKRFAAVYADHPDFSSEW